LGVEVDSITKPKSTDSPTLQKLRDGGKKVQGFGRGRMIFSTPKKTVPSNNELWKVDEDELDEMTMKRLEGVGGGKIICVT
jgi:hypothetical protein